MSISYSYNNENDDKESVFLSHFILQRFHRSNVTLRSSCETREENKLVSKLKFLIQTLINIMHNMLRQNNYFVFQIPDCSKF